MRDLIFAGSFFVNSRRGWVGFVTALNVFEQILIWLVLPVYKNKFFR